MRVLTGTALVATVLWLPSPYPAASRRSDPVRIEPAACPPAQWSRPALDALRAAHWKLDDPGRRAALATALLGCLASRDPALRDGTAFEALSAWMRADLLSPDLLVAMSGDLMGRITAATTDSAGFERPFAVLTLSEIARVDRLHPILSQERRAELLQTALTWLPAVRDYRGFDAREGWRHGVAHGADLLLQLALNPLFGSDDHQRMLAAIATQVAPAGEHFYIYGEGERLARPVIVIARRNTVDAAFWTAWIRQLAGPGPFKDWDTALQSQAGLARRHNLHGFLQALYVNVAGGSDENARRVLLPAVTESLKSLP
jgi:hypothetical protein